MPGIITLDEAIHSLYQIAIVGGRRQSPRRLDRLGEYCVQELAARGLPNVATEQPVHGGGRDKQWDVVWVHEGRARLAISLKSILRNLAGTVPNRIDDLMGEVANAQLGSPEIVLGYIMVMDIAGDTPRKDGTTWHGFLSGQLARLSGRASPHRTVGTLEQAALVAVDFSKGARVISGADSLPGLFDALAAEALIRNPGGAT